MISCVAHACDQLCWSCAYCRLIQRMGRTGRKRSGKIVVFINKGKEERVCMYKLMCKHM